MAAKIGHIDTADPKALAALLFLNNASARETSFLGLEEWHALLSLSWAALCTEDLAAFIVALDQDARYDNPNFRWFRDRHARFVYVDRIVVAPDHRGLGLADRLYGELFSRARASGHSIIGCEINSDPPNPRSDRFHARIGFMEAGQAFLADRGKRVRYLEKPL